MNLKADMKKLYAAGLLGMAVCTSLAYSGREKKGLSYSCLCTQEDNQ